MHRQWSYDSSTRTHHVHTSYVVRFRGTKWGADHARVPAGLGLYPLRATPHHVRPGTMTTSAGCQLVIYRDAMRVSRPNERVRIRSCLVKTEEIIILIKIEVWLSNFLRFVRSEHRIFTNFTV
jgi:hypothetical protein